MVRKSPADKPELYSVPSLDEPLKRPTKMGRPAKLVMPDLPKALLDGMTELEKEWFWFMIDAVKEEFPDLRPLEELQTCMFSLDMINTLRLEVEQLSTKTLVTMSRQHPGVQARAWVDQLRKGRSNQKEAADPDKEKFLKMFN